MKTLPLHEEYVRAGADFGDEGQWLVPGHFGDPTGEYQAAVSGAAVFDLSCRTRFELAGPDARAFLHNLCTNDIKDLPVGAGCEAFLLSSTGKVLAHVLVGHYQRQGGSVLWLDTVPDQAEALGGHLDHYLISENVELADLSAALGQFHVCGPRAAAVLQALVGADLTALPALGNRSLTWPGADQPACVVRHHTAVGLDGYDLFCPADRSLEIWKMLRDGGAVPAGVDTFDTLRIEAGVPEFGVDFDPQRFVMEVGRTTQAICHTKGCYLGQEAVVMARDRGQVSRVLLGVKTPTDGGLLASGARLYKGADEVGLITSSTESPRLKQIIALAYLRRGSQAPGSELVVEPASDGRPVTVCALPFIE